MNETQKMGLVALAIERLSEASSWTGRTHIQKYLYFAQKLLRLNSAYDFVLYQRGPYSFELDSDIRSLRAIGGAEILPKPDPYGPTYVATSSGRALIRHAPVDDTLRIRLDELAQILGPRPARELELIATTLYVLEENHGSDRHVVKRVRSLKPHFSNDEIEGAITEVRALQKKFAPR